MSWPGCAGHDANQHREHGGECPASCVLAQKLCPVSRKKRTDIRHESRRCEFGKHPLFGLRAADRRAAARKVESEAFDYARVIQSFKCLERLEKIEQVASLVSLQQRAQFRRQQLFASSREKVEISASPVYHGFSTR